MTAPALRGTAVHKARGYAAPAQAGRTRGTVMPESGFVAWRKWIQEVASAAGLHCPNRKAAALVMPVATHFGLIDGRLPLMPPYGDPTGEAAVARLLGFA